MNDFTHIINLPNDISNIVFFDYLDESSRFDCLTLDKKINQFVFLKLLKEPQIPYSEDRGSFKQIIEYNQNYCKYLQKKIPNFLFFKNCTTLTKAKEIIELQLIKIRGRNDEKFINQIWVEFLNEFSENQINEKRASIVLKDNSLNYNEEINFLLKAGATRNFQSREVYSGSVKSIINANWCTSETLELIINQYIRNEFNFGLIDLIENILPHYMDLLESKINKISNISNHTIYCALEKGYSENFISLLLKNLNEEVSEASIIQALGKNYSDDILAKLLEKYTQKIEEYTIKIAIENNFSEELILNLLTLSDGNISESTLEIALQKNASENLLSKLLSSFNQVIAYQSSLYEKIVESFLNLPDNLIIQLFSKYDNVVKQSNLLLAVQSKKSENLILTLLNNCLQGTQEEHINAAIKNLYSESLIQKIICNYNPSFFWEEIRQKTVVEGINNNYSEKILLLLIDRVDKRDITNIIGLLIEKGSYFEIIEKYIDQTNFIYIPTLDLIKNEYSENIFIKILAHCYHRYDKKSFLHKEIMKVYPGVINFLLDKGHIKTFNFQFIIALELSYSNSIILKMLDVSAEVISTEIIAKAKELNYSEEVIAKMYEKGPSLCMIM